MNDELYDPCLGMALASELLKKARLVNADRDKDDRERGDLAPGDGPLSDFLRTAMTAIAAGMQGNDVTCIAEGLAMIQDAELLVRVAENARKKP